MVDIIVRNAQGLPEGAYVSVRMGDIRRQMRFKPGSRFHFDGSPQPCNFFALDVFEKVGSAQVGVSELPSLSDHGRKEGSVEVSRNDGSHMTLDLEVAMAAPPDAIESKTPAGMQAKNYLRGQSVQTLLHGMLRNLLEKQPEDALGYMIGYLQDASPKKATTGQPANPAAHRSSCPASCPPREATAEAQQPRPSSSPGMPALRWSPSLKGMEFAELEESEQAVPWTQRPASAPSAAMMQAEAQDYMKERGVEEASDQESSDDECWGFPTEDCPEELPDLSKNYTHVAEVLKNDPSVHKELRGVRTPNGISLARCIKPGMDMLRSHPLLRVPGIVAGDAESYDVFREVFDPVISAVHQGVDVATLRHPHDMDVPKVRDVSIDSSGEYVLGAQLRACRNLRGFRMAPGCSPEERREVERLAVEVLSSGKGDLHGCYYPIAGSKSWPGNDSNCLSPEDAQWLLDERLLPHEPDSELAVACGLNRDWPDGRGTFLVDSKRLVVSLNEEDHVLLTVLGPGGDLKKAFGLLQLAHCNLQDCLAAVGHQLAFSDRLGFLGVSPANLGTCLVATLSLRLPQLAANQQRLEDLAEELGVRLRRRPAKAGESTLGSCTFDVSNSSRLGSSEVDQVNLVLEAGRDLVALERRLRSGGGLRCQDARAMLAAVRCQDDAATVPASGPPSPRAAKPHEADAARGGLGDGQDVVAGHEEQGEAAVQVVASQPLPRIPEGEAPEELPDLSRHHSLMANSLRRDPSIYARLRPVRTNSGVSLWNCIKPGIDVCGHPWIKTVGLVAGDAECYEAFRDVFEPVAEAAHPGKLPQAAHPSGLDFTQVTDEPLDHGGAHVWHVRLSARRNLAGLRFTPACSSVERSEVERCLVRALTGSLHGEYFQLQGLGSQEVVDAVGEDLLFQEPDSNAAHSSGISRDWPEARGVFLARGHELAAWVNAEDHLRLWSVRPGADISGAFRSFCEAEMSVRNAVRQDGRDFAWNHQLGYATVCPSELGTALRVEVRVRLPLLGAQPGFHMLCGKLGLRVFACAPGGAVAAGRGTWDVSNTECLGCPEVAMVNAVAEAVRHLVNLEQMLERGEEVDAEAMAEKLPCRAS